MNKVSFNRESEKQMRMFVVFIAQVIREGVTYKIHETESEIVVEFTGAF